MKHFIMINETIYNLDNVSSIFKIGDTKMSIDYNFSCGGEIARSIIERDSRADRDKVFNVISSHVLGAKAVGGAFK